MSKKKGFINIKYNKKGFINNELTISNNTSIYRVHSRLSCTQLHISSLRHLLQEKNSWNSSIRITTALARWIWCLFWIEAEVSLTKAGHLWSTSYRLYNICTVRILIQYRALYSCVPVKGYRYSGISKVGVPNRTNLYLCEIIECGFALLIQSWYISNVSV